MDLWVKRCPNPMLGPSEVEIRPVMEMADNVFLGYRRMA